MELIAISLARFVAFLELQSFDPRGQTTLHDGIQAFKSRYSFAKSPEKPEDLNFQTGVEFLDGGMGNIAIDKLVLYANGLAVDTRSSTENCERVVEDILKEVKERTGSMMLPTRRMYVSEVIFRSSMRFHDIHPVIRPLAERVASALTEYLGQSVNVDLTSLAIGPDKSQTKLAPLGFSIERRADTPFSDDIYFSGAPVKTDLHISLVEQFEREFA